MNKLFIHLPLFRLLSPFFSGVIVYLLILLINNNVEQLEEHFLGQELYVCIGLSYLTQEFSRISLVLFKKLNKPSSYFLRIVLQIFISIALCIIIVSTAIYLYYFNVLGFTPNFSELSLFNSIFSCIALIYISLYLSHQFLHKINTEKIADEMSIKKEMEEDFRQFKKGINPKLLFESFESLIVLMHKDKEMAEEFIDHFSMVYRYILSGKNNQLTSFKDETKVLKELISLFNYLPYRKIEVETDPNIESLIVPGSLLFTIENIIRSTITAPDLSLKISVSDNAETILINYQTHEKITAVLELKDFEEINRSYSVYTDQSVFVSKEGNNKIIGIPKLQAKEYLEEV